MISRIFAHSDDRPGRQGYALIEMIAVMSVSAMILAVLFTAITGMARRSSELDEAVARLKATSAVARLLRDELSTAESFVIAADGSLVSKRGEGDERTLRFADRPFRLELAEAGKPRSRVIGLTGFESGRFERFEIEGGLRPMAAIELRLDQRRSRRLNRPADEKPLRLEFAVGAAQPPRIDSQSKKAEVSK